MFRDKTRSSMDESSSTEKADGVLAKFSGGGSSMK
jgi:hypothetical protein